MPFQIGSTLEGKNLFQGSKFFPLRAVPYFDGRQKENGRVASPESVPIYSIKIRLLIRTSLTGFAMIADSFIKHPLS